MFRQGARMSLQGYELADLTKEVKLILKAIKGLKHIDSHYIEVTDQLRLARDLLKSILEEIKEARTPTKGE
jgi:hypothetical protein